MSEVALADAFYRLHAQAELDTFVARLQGREVELLPYEEVRRRLRAQGVLPPVLREIPIAAIVGSVGRQSDFTRTFLPRNSADQGRWMSVARKVEEMEGLPPIRVLQVGEAYFVEDGHHRVSVARQLGAREIEAYVSEVLTEVALPADAGWEDVLRLSARVEFLDETGLDIRRPDHGIEASSGDNYRSLLRHVRLHLDILRFEGRTECGCEDAAEDWFDHIYAPVVTLIRDQQLLREFAGWTEADLYLLVSGYRVLADEALDWEVVNRTSENCGDLPARQDSCRPRQTLSAEIMPGEWRRQRLWAGEAGSARSLFRLFTSVLVPVTGQPAGWPALETALQIAHREQGRVLGLYVLPRETSEGRARAELVRADFNERCRTAGTPGGLAVEVGDVASRIAARTPWADLTVIKMAYPPPANPLARLSSGFRTLIRSSASPLLILPGATVPGFASALVAYNGGPKAEQALLLAAYLAIRGGMQLTVLNVSQKAGDAEAVLERAEARLRTLRATARLVWQEGPVAETIVRRAESQGHDLIVLGGYSRAGILEMTLGSSVDQVLRSTWLPTLIMP